MAIIEIQALKPQNEKALADFFGLLKAAGDEPFFHPHPLSREEATVRAQCHGKDIYVTATEGEQILGYGMLRGWDEGFSIPSLGIAVHPERRGLGIGRMLMEYLHVAARQRGAKTVRLTVDASNKAALSLYHRLGYQFKQAVNGGCVGLLDLAPQSSAVSENTQAVSVAQPDLSGNERRYVTECLDTSWISSKGRFIDAFESAFAAYVGVDQAVSVCNGTVALQLILHALGIGAGDEVIVPALTYVASASVVLHAGAVPVFVDVDPKTWNMTPQTVAEAITARTRAIMAVHLYGNPVDMVGLRSLCESRGILLIEDAAEAIGSEDIGGGRAGGLGHVAAFSFFGNKTLSTGEGGMVTTQDAVLARKMRQLKNQGESPDRRYWHDRAGFNYRMTNIQAALGLAQLEQVEKFVARKRAIAQRYQSLLDHPGLRHSFERPATKHGQWMSSVVVADPFDLSARDLLMEKLKERGIETRPFFHPMHQLPIFSSLQSKRFPVAEVLSRRGINLPSSTRLSDETVERVSRAVLECLAQLEGAYA